mmetsp:Transcript_17015/g.52541  ORF Transcript_17015/g.52541 Transcript_17015/m.52541 type:complete len:274 (-) Transcript_17015:781-1602(-)
MLPDDALCDAHRLLHHSVRRVRPRVVRGTRGHVHGLCRAWGLEHAERTPRVHVTIHVEHARCARCHTSVARVGCGHMRLHVRAVHPKGTLTHAEALLEAHGASREGARRAHLARLKEAELGTRLVWPGSSRAGGVEELRHRRLWVHGFGGDTLAPALRAAHACEGTHALVGSGRPQWQLRLQGWHGHRVVDGSVVARVFARRGWCSEWVCGAEEHAAHGADVARRVRAGRIVGLRRHADDAIARPRERRGTVLEGALAAKVELDLEVPATCSC